MIRHKCIYLLSIADCPHIVILPCCSFDDSDLNMSSADLHLKNVAPSEKFLDTCILDGRNIQPAFNEQTAVGILIEYYGLIPCAISELESYLDRNYLVLISRRDGDGLDEYVLKFYNQRAAKHSDQIELKHKVEALCCQHIKCPIPVTTLEGARFVEISSENGDSHIVDLHKYIEGIPFKKISVREMDPQIFYEIGVMAATIDQIAEPMSLQFSHMTPGFNIWHLENAPLLKRLLHLVPDHSRRSTLANIIQRFENEALNNLDNLPTGTIHYDLSDGNIMLLKDDDGVYKLHGVIDFGDLSHNSPYIFELGVAATYILIHTFADKTLSPVKQLISGYRTLRKLSSLELSILPIIILTRMAYSYLMSIKSDERNAYASACQEAAWKVLERYGTDDHSLNLDDELMQE